MHQFKAIWKICASGMGDGHHVAGLNEAIQISVPRPIVLVAKFGRPVSHVSCLQHQNKNTSEISVYRTHAENSQGSANIRCLNTA